MSVFISSTGNDDHLDGDITALGLDHTARMLMHVWAFMPTATIAAGQYMIYLDDGLGGGGSIFSIQLSGGEIRATYKETGAVNSGATAALAMPKDQWVAVSWIGHPVVGGMSTGRLFVDGAEIDNDPTSTTVTARAYTRLRIGTRSSNNLSTWQDGRLAEASIFNNLTEADAITLAQCLGGNGLPAGTGTAADHADVLAIATPVLYNKLLTDASPTFGGITPTSATLPPTAFDGGIHPTLTDPVAKGSAATMPIVAML